MNKSKIINFEWMCDSNHYTDDEFDIIRNKLIENDIRQAALEGYNIIFGLYLVDGFLHCAKRKDVFISQMNYFKKISDELNVKIILVSGQGETLEGLPFDSIFFDYTFRMTYWCNRDYFNKGISFNDESNKFLFFGGMPTRPNRIGLLSRYYDSGLLDYSEWSFFPPVTADDKKWCRNHLSKYSDAEYDTFIKYAERSFDYKYQAVLPYYGGYETEDTEYLWYDIVKTDFIKSPTFVPTDVFTKTCFSVISEGPNFWSSDNYFVTEKTWRTFLFKHPFIFVGHPDQFRYLKNLGYSTFENYMEIKDYAYIENESDRLDAVCKNTKSFLKTFKTFSNIKDEVEHNHNLFFKYAEKQNSFLERLKTDYGADTAEVDYFLNRTGYEHLIRKVPDGF